MTTETNALKDQPVTTMDHRMKSGFFADADFVRDTLIGLYALNSGRPRVTLEALVKERNQRELGGVAG